MSILKIVGIFLAVLGVACGVLMLLSPIHPLDDWAALPFGKIFALGVLFVLLSAIGLIMSGLGGGGKAAIDQFLFLLGSAWLILGLLAIVALIAELIGLLHAEATLIWWLMALGCSIVGGIGVTMGARQRSG